MYACFDSLHGVVLVVDGASGASQVVDLVHLNVQGECDVMADKFETWVIEQVLNVALVAGVEVIGTDNFVSSLEQTIDEVGS